MTGVPDPGFEALSRRIAEVSGVELGAYKGKCLRRRLAVRMRACGVHTYTDYLGVLDGTPTELDRLLDALTINVTRFFRNGETWDRVAQLVIPTLLESREGRVRIWTAGCASGEEPYTLAILFAEALDRQSRGHWLERLSIEATDIDRISLERARAGCYQAAALSDTPPALLARYFEPLPEGGFQVVERLRAAVRITRHDLIAEPPPRPPYDLITCRNVIIYFDRPSQEALLERFYTALVPAGFLLLGKVETIFGPARARLELIDARERIYRRID